MVDPTLHARYMSSIIMEVCEFNEPETASLYTGCFSNWLEKKGHNIYYRIGEDIEIYHKNEWHKATVTELNPLIVKRDNDWISCEYDQVRHRRRGRESRMPVPAWFSLCEEMPLDVIKKWIAFAPNINTKNTLGQSSLIFSSRAGRYDIVQYLLQKDADINHTDHCGITALYISCANFHYDVSELLLQSGAEVNVVTDDGNSPLLAFTDKTQCTVKVEHLSCMWSLAPKEEEVPIMRLLLEHDADINHENTHGDTALHLASKLANRLDMINLLLDFQADINKKNENGNTPLTLCTNLEVMDLLLNNGADINEPDISGNTPLIITIMRLNYRYSSVKNDKSIQMMLLLLEHQADLNQVDIHGNSPLFHCIERGHLQSVELLLHHDVLVNPHKKHNVTPLCLAIHQNHDSIVALLLDYGVDINQAPPQELPPLLAAVKICVTKEHDNLSIIIKLLQSKADVDQCRGDGRTPLYVAATNKNDTVVKLLLEYGADANKIVHEGRMIGTILFHSCSCSNVSIVKMLIDHGTDLNQWYMPESNISLLEIAVSCENYAITELLLEHNVRDINERNPGPRRRQRTAFFEACGLGLVEIANLLLEHNADLNQPDIQRTTPIHIAAIEGHLPVVELLIQHQADINRQGVSPLRDLNVIRHEEILQLLNKSSKCNYCNRVRKKLRQCLGCKSTFYCSAKCRSLDWNQHKLSCPGKPKKKKKKKQSFVTKRSCDYCQSENVQNTCDGCRDAYYCSKQCQRLDWSFHRDNCHRED